MTPANAVYSFMSAFGIPAYAATSVPSDAGYPYLTYTMAYGDFWSGEVPLEMDLWYRGDSEAPANAKAVEVAGRLGGGGEILPCDGGAIWLKKGSPFCQSMADGTDDKVKRRYINLVADFITA